MAVSHTKRLITEPTVEPVTLAELKDHAVIEHCDDDMLLQGYITAARKQIENRLGIAIVRQKWRIYLDSFHDDIPLTPYPVREVDQVQYLDGDDTTQTLATTVYDVDLAAQRMVLAYQQSWPSTLSDNNAVWVDVWSGFYDETASPVDISSKIPQDIKVAINILAAGLGKDRESTLDMQVYENRALDMLLLPYWQPHL